MITQSLSPFLKIKLNLFFHLNIASLGLQELETALSLLDLKFDVIGITETKIVKGIPPLTDPSLSGYEHYDTHTECSKGVTLIYVMYSLVCNRRKYLENIMYKSNNLESVSVEIEITGKKNEIFW